MLVNDFPGNRGAVLVHIEYRHEDRNLKPFIFKIFFLVNFFNVYDFSVSRRKNMIFIFSISRLGSRKK